MFFFFAEDLTKYPCSKTIMVLAVGTLTPFDSKT